MNTHPSDPFDDLEATEEGRRLMRQEQLLTKVAIQVDRMRERAGISRTELAQRLGVTRGNVTQILGGNRNLSLRKLCDLFFALGHGVDVVPASLEAENASRSVRS